MRGGTAAPPSTSGTVAAGFGLVIRSSEGEKSPPRVSRRRSSSVRSNLHLTFLVSQDQLKGSIDLNTARRERCQRGTTKADRSVRKLRDEPLRRSTVR